MVENETPWKINEAHSRRAVKVRGQPGTSLQGKKMYIMLQRYHFKSPKDHRTELDWRLLEFNALLLSIKCYYQKAFIF